MFLGLDSYYECANPAQALTTASEELDDLNYLSDLRVSVYGIPQVRKCK